MTYKMKQNCLNFSSLVVFMLILQPIYAQYNFKSVDDWLEKNQKNLDGNVIALLYKDGKVIYKKEIGKEFTIKTQAPIANSSKWLSTALIMMFVDEGKISLDDPIAQYLPIFESYGKKYITIRHCLAHTTGIKADPPGFKATLLNKRFNTLEEEVNSFAKREIDRNPTEMFFYSNIGVNIVGRILEVVSKKSFDRLILEKLLRPLKMRNTTFYIDYSRAFNPSTGALSTANDYLTFLSMILNKGMFEGKRFLSEAAIAEMQKIQTGNAIIKYEPITTAGYKYGLGQWIMETDATGKATAISCPGLYGIFPIIDNCREYAFILFVKEALNEQKKELYISLKKTIDEQIASVCK